MLIVFGAAMLGVLVEAFVPRAAAVPVQVALSRWPAGRRVRLPSWSLGAYDLRQRQPVTIAARARSPSTAHPVHPGHDPGAGLRRRAAHRRRRPHQAGAFAAAGARPTPRRRRQERESQARPGWLHTEVFPLMMFAVGGMLLFPAANDLLTMFVALEVLSLPLYLLCGLARRRRLLSQEAALKYFLLGAFSSAFFLYGVALLYGYAGSVSAGRDRRRGVSRHRARSTLLFAGIALLGVGLLFKVGAAPFHSWTPDVYQGAPTPVTALHGGRTKVAAFGALLRVFYVAFGGLTWDWRPVHLGGRDR